MNNLFALLRRPRAVIPLVIFAVLLAAIIVGIATKSDSKNKTSSTKTSTVPANYPKALKQKDQQKTNGMYSMINLITYTYTNAQLNYPTADADGWKDILTNAPSTDAFVDPYTNTFYTYSSKTPDYGQIQYLPGGACNTKTNTFKAGTYRTIALRTKLYSGVRCISSVEVQAMQSHNVEN